MTDSTACPGRCNSAFRKAMADYEQALTDWSRAHHRWTEARGWATGPGDHIEATTLAATEPVKPEPPDTQPYPGIPVWCTRCTATIRWCLSQIDTLAAMVTASIDGYRPQSSDPRVSGTTRTRSPDPRVDMLDELLRDFLAWEDDYRARREFPSREQRGRAHITLTRCTAWLGVHLDSITGQTWTMPDQQGREWRAGEAFGQAILDWHRRLEAATKTTPDTHRKPGRCERCGCATLWLVEADRPDDRRVECRGYVTPDRECGRMYGLDEYDALIGNQTEGGAR